MKWLKRLFGKAGFDPSLQVLSDERMANIWGAGGGSGQSGETRYNWNPFMENMWAGGSKGNPGLLNRAVDTLNTPYTPYGGQRIAGINQDQGNAIGGIRHLSTQGSDIGNLGSQATQATLRGDFLNNPYYNPDAVKLNDQTYSPNMVNSWWEPSYNEDRVNPAMQTERLDPKVDTTQLQAGQNQFMGDNPYFRGVLEKGIGDITNAYQRGTSADLRRAANLSGAFGGSAHQAAIKNNEEALGGNISNFVNQMANQQYDRSANLRESDIGRQMQAGQFNIGGMRDNANTMNQAQMYNIGLGDKNIDRSFLAQQFNSGISDRNADRSNQSQQFNIGTVGQNIDRLNQGSQYNIGLNNQNIDRQNQFLGMGGQSWDAERNRMSQAGNQAINYENQGFNRFNNLMGVGDFGRSYEQSLLDNQYNDWQQGQNWERSNLNWMANLLSQAQGGTGVTTQMGGYQGISPAAGLLGAAAVGRGMNWI